MTTLSREQLRALLHEVGLAHRADEIMAAVRPGINVDRQRVQDEAEIPIGASKLGGNPDLPPGFVWPTYKGVPLTFLAQFNLAEVKPYDVENLLPDDGMLHFFYELEERRWGMDEEDAGSFKTIYDPVMPLFHNQTLMQLVRLPHPVTPTRYDWLTIRALPACKVEFATLQTLPDYAEWFRMGFMDRNSPDDGLDDEFETRVFEKERLTQKHTLDEYIPGHQLLGNPTDIGHSVRADAFGRGRLYSGNWKHSYNETVRGSLDYQLLVQFDSDKETNVGLDVGWVDLGTLSFCIHKDDLRAQRFRQAWCILQSS